MSKGGSSSKSSPVIDPALKGAYLENYASAKGVANRPYDAPALEVAGFNPTQTQAQNMYLGIAGNNVGGNTLNQGIGAANSVANYNPSNVSTERLSLPYMANQYTPQNVSTGSVTDSLPLTVANYNPNNISAGQLSDTDLSAYMNPYIQNVIASTLANNETARLGARTADQQKATAAGAFGGSRSGVMGSLTNAAYDKNALDSVSSLLSQGYTNAQGAALSDIGNRLTADQANQSAGLQDYGLDIQNLGQGQSTLLADLARQLSAQTSNQSAGLAGAELQLQNLGQAQQAESSDLARMLAAQQSNQSAGLAGAGLRLDASGALAGMSAQELQQAMTQAGLVEGVGAQQQAMTQAELDALYQNMLNEWNYPLQQQDILNQALGLYPPVGQQSSSTQSSGSGGLLGGIGSIVQGAAMIPGI